MLPITTTVITFPMHLGPFFLGVGGVGGGGGGGGGGIDKVAVPLALTQKKLRSKRVKHSG